VKIRLGVATHDAEEEFQESYALLKEVIEYFSKRSDKLPTCLIHSAIYFLRDHLNLSPNSIFLAFSRMSMTINGGMSRDFLDMRFGFFICFIV
jgi:hypothetical protein